MSARERGPCNKCGVWQMDTYACGDETDQLMSHSQTYSMPTRTPMVHQYMERFWMASVSFRERALYVAKAGRRNANQALEGRWSAWGSCKGEEVAVPHKMEDESSHHDLISVSRRMGSVPARGFLWAIEGRGRSSHVRARSGCPKRRPRK